MTGNVVPGKADYNLTLLKCWKCGTLYSTDQPLQTYVDKEKRWRAYEACPVCGCDTNSNECKMNPFAFKLIRWWRGRKGSGK